MDELIRQFYGSQPWLMPHGTFFATGEGAAGGNGGTSTDGEDDGATESDDDNAEGAGGDEGDHSDETKKLSLTQQELDDLINKRIGRVVSQKERRWKESIPASVRDLMEKASEDPDILERIPDLISGKVHTSKDAVQKEELEKLLSQRETRVKREYEPIVVENMQLKERVGTLETKIRRSDLMVAAGRAGTLPEAINQVVLLVEGFFQDDEDTGDLIAVDRTQNVQFDPETSKPFTPEGFIKAWLQDNPHFLPAGSRPGAGSRNGSGHKRGTGTTLEELQADYDKAMQDGNVAYAIDLETRMAPMRSQRYASRR